MTINPLAAEQVRRNCSRDGEWELSAEHRRHLTERAVALAPPHSGRLCVLGAGNSNDLNLAALRGVFREIHLVDIDQEALARGVLRQFGPAPPPEVQLHGGIDLTGIWAALVENSVAADWQSPVWHDLAVQAANPGLFFGPAPFDVVMSAGMLSQLVEAVTRCVPEHSPRYWELLLAVRTGHLRLAARLTAPGGRLILVSDFVSSATCAPLDQVAELDLGAVAQRLAAERNFFHGLNPVFLPTLFGTDPALRELIAEVKPPRYWLWHQRARTYAVMALECQRRTVALPD